MKPFDRNIVDQHISVLYVEDQLDIQEEFVDILSLFVDEVFVAVDGDEGLKKYNENLPDIIITDIQMPIMSGLQMIQKIREGNKEIPIVVTTAFNDSKYLLEAITLGVEHYLLKPVMIDQLQERLETIKKRLMQQRELDIYQLYLEERVEAEVALREEKESLLIQQNKAAEIGQMVSVIAHQWKQPLHYLHLLIEDLGMEYDYQPLSREYIDEFTKKGLNRIDFLSETMDNFLHFYKSDTAVKRFAASTVVQEITAFLLLPYQALGISLQIDVHNDFFLLGIKNEFQQVILNLLNNAKEAFDAKKNSQKKVIVSLSIENNKGILFIEDSAGGIDEKIIDDLFKLEYTTKKNGNGIGLYLVEKIVTKRFSGSVSVANSAEGARFTLAFELEKASA